MFYTTISKNSNKIMPYHSQEVSITISLERNKKKKKMISRFEQQGD